MDGAPGIAGADPVAVYVRMSHVTVWGRRIGFDRLNAEPVRCVGAGDLIHAQVDPERPQVDAFKRDRIGLNRKSVFGAIHLEGTELVLGSPQFFVERTQAGSRAN